MRLAVRLALSLLPFLCASALRAAAAEPQPSETVTIQADAVQLDLDRGRTQAQGSALLSYQDLRLHADQITAEENTGEVQASGHLSLTQNGRRLQGDLLHYNFRSEEGALSQARLEEQGVIIRGESLEFSPQKMVARNAYFTTCDLPDPHYTFGASLITLTAAQTGPGQRPQSGRLTLNRATVTYHHRRLFTVPHYSVSVGQLGEPSSSPLPASGFSRDDGPFASIGYTLGRPEGRALADFGYRYTTFRGIRGHLRLRQDVGPAQFTLGYTRREDVADQELRGDEIHYSLANVLVNRSPEYGIKLPDLAVGRALHLRAEWLRGTYSERLSRVVDTRARADRDSITLMLSTNAYTPGRHLALSHAIGWRRSTYSPGDELTISYFRHSLDFAPRPDTRLSLAYITRRGSGQSPFLFDQVGIGRELLADARFRLSPSWKVRLEDVYDLRQRQTKDMAVAITRTAHCLDYTFGWRKLRGSFFLLVGLTPPAGP
jgi:lipopolysaccharide export system protein LptA